MLTIGKLAAGPTAGRYYVDQVAQGREDYYAGEGEAPGEWTGTGATSLGLHGAVREEGVVRLLSLEDPVTGELLGRPPAPDTVAGFDLTFRAPKSVGVLFGVCEPEIVWEIVSAHDAAVAEALGYLEREACLARRGRGGAVTVSGGGFVGAAFRHRSSRAGDPLLHTHVVVANAARGPDGRWTALDGRLLYRHAKTAGYLYHAALRAELTERLGVRWHEVQHGTADVVGVPRAVIQHFSRRRAEILEYMATRGEHSARAAQVATVETRRRKRYGVPVDRLREEWRARAAEHGLTHAETLLARRGQPPLPAGVTAHKLRHTSASILFVRGEDPPYVMAQLGHTDPAFTLRVYAHAMRRDEGDKERLKALVEGREWAPLATTGPDDRSPRAEEQSPENEETPAVAGVSEDGRGGFRTCDLSRVKRALSH
jgi:conjugative relaxase-like TrwC/TraI family protein